MNFGDQVLKAAAEGDIDGLRRIFQDDAALVNMGNNEGKSPLHFAAENGHSQVAQFLLDEGANLQEDGPDTPLMLASVNGHLETVNLLLDRGANIHNKHLRGPTALHLAAQMGHIKVVNALLQRGAKVGCVGSIGQEALTPLHFAAMNGHVEVVRTLLSHKARVGVKGEDGSTPLHVALLSDGVAMPDRIAIVKQLLARKADCSAHNRQGETPYEIALSKGFTEIAELFRATGSKTKSQLFQLIRDDDHKNVKKLLESTRGIVDLEEDGDKPIHVAARCARTSILYRLLEHRADINAQGREGKTALHLAVLHLHEVRNRRDDDTSASQTLITILMSEPDLDIRDGEGDTAWDVAFGCDEEQVCFWIQEAERLQKAHQANIAEIRYTVAETEEGLEVHDIQAVGWDAEGVIFTDDETTKYAQYFLDRRNWHGGLGEFDANPVGRLVWDVYTRRVSPAYPIDHPEGEKRLAKTFLRVVMGGKLHTAEQLLAETPALADTAAILRRSPNPNVSVRKRIPLSVAAEYGRDDMCRLLIASGADVNKADTIYSSPLLAAAWGGHLSTVILLIEAGIEKKQIKDALRMLNSPRIVIFSDSERAVDRPDNPDVIISKLHAAAADAT